MAPRAIPSRTRKPGNSDQPSTIKPAPEGKAPNSRSSQELPSEAYDHLIRFATQYGRAAGNRSSEGHLAERSAEIAYIVIDISKGDARVRLRRLADKLGVSRGC
jgi:hypothetical protein